MKKHLSKVSNLPYYLAAAATVALYSDQASADGQNLGQVATNVTSQMGEVGKLMVAGGFVGGIVMLASGLMKLKQAADTQGNQVKYSEGMWRVAVGAGLVAIPAFSGLLTQTFSLGTPATITPGGGASF